jgi:3'(2'), 5'-bisphosphate nucleotidase
VNVSLPPALAHLGDDVRVALRAVAGAVDVARAVERDAAREAMTKADTSPVTAADYAVQAIVAARLSREVPGLTLVAEEDASALRTPEAAGLIARVADLVRRHAGDVDSGDVLAWIDRGAGDPGLRFWTLDPIDGTKGLLRGGQYAIALALIVDGRVEAGVLACPRLAADGPMAPAPAPATRRGGIAVAARGRGAWWLPLHGGRPVRLAVSTVGEPSRARVLHSYESAHTDMARCRARLEALGVRPAPTPMDSQAKHVVLAAGGADVLLRAPSRPGAREAIWDHAAGCLIVEEAGGRVTDLRGRPLDFSTGERRLPNEGLLATNGRLHDAFLGSDKDGGRGTKDDGRRNFAD